MKAGEMLVWLALMVCGVSCDNCTHVALLEKLHLMEKNNTLAHIRPVLNLTTRTQVKVDMFLRGILDVNEKSQTLTCSINTLISWENEFLSWDPREFCGKKSIHVPKEKIWRPEIVIIEDISDSSSIRSSRFVRVFPGLVQTIRSQKLTISCSMDMYQFPMDLQICTLTFFSFLNHDDILLGSLFTQDMKTNYTRENLNQGEWDFLFVEMIESNYSVTGADWSQLEYKIHIKRRPLLYLLNLAIPIILFLVLDLASFFIDQSRGEKLSFKITILLSISVLLLILHDILPSTANKLPLIALHCITIFFMVGFSLLESILVGFLGDLDAKGIQEDPSPILSSATGGTPPARDPPLEEVELEESCDEQRKVSGQERDHREAGYWGRLATRIDNTYFCLYLFSTVLFLIYLSVQWFL